MLCLRPTSSARNGSLLWTSVRQLAEVTQNCLYNFFLFFYKNAWIRYRRPLFTPWSRLRHVFNMQGCKLVTFQRNRRFHLEIGHSRESCRSVKKNWGEGGGVVVVVLSAESSGVTSPVAFFPCWQRNGPALLCLWLATLCCFPHPTPISHSWSLAFRRRRQLSIFRTECICIGCKLWCSSLNGDYRVRLLFFFLFVCFCVRLLLR